MRALRPFAVACAALLVALLVLSAVAPTTTRALGLRLQARNAVEMDGVEVRMEAHAYVDRMIGFCFDGPCPGDSFLLGVDVSTAGPALPRVRADSAWVLVGPLVYPLQLDRGSRPWPPSSRTAAWDGHAWTRLPLQLLRADVVVRLVTADGRVRLLRTEDVQIGEMW